MTKRKGRPSGTRNAVSIKISHRIMDQIEAIAAAARVHPEQVLEDVLDYGLYGAKNEMYAGLINSHSHLEQYRQTLRDQANEQRPDEASTTEELAQDVQQGTASANVGVEAASNGHLPALQDTADGLDPALVGPGLGAESGETLDSDRGVL
jgi:hypothetical protein